MKEVPAECPFPAICKTIINGEPPLERKGAELGKFIADLKIACKENSQTGLTCFSKNADTGCGMSPSSRGHLSDDHRRLISYASEPLARLKL